MRSRCGGPGHRAGQVAGAPSGAAAPPGTRAVRGAGGAGRGEPGYCRGGSSRQRRVTAEGLMWFLVAYDTLSGAILSLNARSERQTERLYSCYKIFFAI